MQHSVHLYLYHKNEKLVFLMGGQIEYSCKQHSGLLFLYQTKNYYHGLISECIAMYFCSKIFGTFILQVSTTILMRRRRATYVPGGTGAVRSSALYVELSIARSAQKLKLVGLYKSRKCLLWIMDIWDMTVVRVKRHDAAIVFLLLLPLSLFQ